MPNMYLKCRGTSARFLDKNVRHVEEKLLGKQIFFYFKIDHYIEASSQMDRGIRKFIYVKETKILNIPQSGGSDKCGSQLILPFCWLLSCPHCNGSILLVLSNISRCLKFADRRIWEILMLLALFLFLKSRKFGFILP